MTRNRGSVIDGAILVAVVGLAWGACADPRVAVVFIGGLIGVYVMLTRPHKASPALLLLALPFMRPFLFGERYASIGTGLALAAAALALWDDGGQGRMDRALRSLLLWTGLLWLWQIALVERIDDPTNTAKGLATVALAVLCAAVVLRDQARRLFVLRWIVIAVVAGCASFMVTFVIWRLAGKEAAELLSLPAGYQLDYYGFPSTGVPLDFPFTTVYAQYLPVPRYLGWGREAGMGAVVIGWAYLMLNRLGPRYDRWWIKLILIAGLLGTRSTAGFGIVLAVWVIQNILIIHRKDSNLLAFGRVIAGFAALGLAYYLAVYAPVFGVQAKRDINAESYETRQFATSNGWKALHEKPWGQVVHITKKNQQVGINIIGAAAETGLPGLVTSVGLLTLPLVRSRSRGRAAGPVLLILGTCLTAQPLLHSTGLYVLVALATLSYPRDDEEAGDQEDVQSVIPAHAEPGWETPHEARPTREARSRGMPR